DREGEPAGRERRREGGLPLRPALVHAARQRTRAAAVRTATELHAAVAEHTPDAPDNAPTTPEGEDLRLKDADDPPPRAEAEPVPAFGLRSNLLDVTKKELRGRARAVAAVRPDAPTCVDALLTALEAAIRRVCEGAGRARGAVPELRPCGLQAGIAARTAGGRGGGRADHRE